MELKEKIINQFYFAQNRWLTFNWTTTEILSEAEAILEPAAPRSLFQNISIKVANTVKSAISVLDKLSRYVIAAVYLIVAVPGVTISHAAEKFMVGVRFVCTSISNAFNNLLSRFMNTNTTTTTVAVTANIAEAIEIPEVTEIIESPDVTPSVTETQIVVYQPNLLSFSNNHKPTQDDRQRFFDKLVKKLEQANDKSLIEKLKREHALYSDKKTYTLVSPLAHEADDKARNFAQANEHKLILAGLELLEDEKFLKESSYKGLFNTLKLKEFMASESNDLDTQRLDYLTAILCVAWALDALNKIRGYDVIRGSSTITNNESIFKFFLGYVQLVTGSNDPGYFINYSSFAYGRNPNNQLSSHYKNDSKQYGIDMRLEAYGKAFGILPHGHSHILFGLIKSDPTTHSTFFKFEPHGMGTFSDLMQHGIEFANSGKVSGVTYREKDVPKEFKEVYDKFCEQTGEIASAKLIKDMWQHINDYINKNLPSVMQHNDDDEHTNWDVVRNHDISPPGLDAKAQFKLIANSYKMSIKDLHYRCGKEVLMGPIDSNTINDAFIHYESNSKPLRA